jgi:hypothetical protein
MRLNLKFSMHQEVLVDSLVQEVLVVLEIEEIGAVANLE